MKRLLPVVTTALLAAACAAAKPVEKMSADEAFGAPVAAPVSAKDSRAALGAPKEWAKQWRQDLACERGARDLEQVHGHDVAWTYMKSCITKGGFIQLKTLCDNWTEDLKTRPEAGSIIAQVIAARGGHVKSDLESIQQFRIPLFDLGSALKQASAFKGRYLLVVAKISETKETKGKTELVLQEQAISSEASSVMTGTRSGSVSSSTGSGSVGWKSNGAVGSGSASGSYSKNTRTEYGKVETRVTDFFEETGQELLAKIKQPDPFLQVDKNLIFLLRFDGTAVGDTENTGEGGEPRKTALVTLISYHDL